MWSSGGVGSHLPCACCGFGPIWGNSLRYNSVYHDGRALKKLDVLENVNQLVVKYAPIILCICLVKAPPGLSVAVFVVLPVQSLQFGAWATCSTGCSSRWLSWSQADPIQGLRRWLPSPHPCSCADDLLASPSNRVSGCVIAEQGGCDLVRPGVHRA